MKVFKKRINKGFAKGVMLMIGFSHHSTDNSQKSSIYAGLKDSGQFKNYRISSQNGVV